MEKTKYIYIYKNDIKLKLLVASDNNIREVL